MTLPVDFVLESGTGELEALPDISSSADARPEEGGLPLRDTAPVLLVDGSSQPQNARSHHVQTCNGPEHHARGIQTPSGLRTSEKRRLRSQQRSWPLRDPEEARLLQHFVERVTPFVR